MSQSGVTLLDGGTGTELRMRGVEVPSHVTSIWSARALYADPDAVVAVHGDYIRAGADVITANNYAVTPPLLAREGVADRLEELTLRAVELACRARDASDRAVRIAGSLPPLDTSYRADLVGENQALLDGYRRIAELLEPRVDLLLCETLSSAREAVAAATVAAETGREFWLSWTLQGSRPGRLPSGETVTEAFEAASGHAASGYLVNCCGANFVTQALPELRSLTDAPIGGYANAADVLPGSDPIDYRPLDPDGYASEVSQWIARGATLVGGCCFTRPAHIERIREMLEAR